MELKALISSENVDAIYIDGKYQDLTQPLSLSEENIGHYQYACEITTKDSRKIQLYFNEITDLNDFVKAYGLR